MSCTASWKRKQTSHLTSILYQTHMYDTQPLSVSETLARVSGDGWGWYHQSGHVYVPAQTWNAMCIRGACSDVCKLHRITDSPKHSALTLRHSDWTGSGSIMFARAWLSESITWTKQKWVQSYIISSITFVTLNTHTPTLMSLSSHTPASSWWSTHGPTTSQNVTSCQLEWLNHVSIKPCPHNEQIQDKEHPKGTCTITCSVMCARIGWWQPWTPGLCPGCIATVHENLPTSHMQIPSAKSDQNEGHLNMLRLWYQAPPTTHISKEEGIHRMDSPESVQIKSQNVATITSSMLMQACVNTTFILMQAHILQPVHTQQMLQLFSL